MSKTLTDRSILALKPKEGKRLLLHDHIVPGLAVRMTEGGVKTFVLIKRLPGKRNPVPRALGRYGELTIVTPFGPMGPGLTLGQIIEAEPVSTGVWRYVRSHFKPAVRSWRVFCEQLDVLNKPDISQDLQLLRELNCEWEWSVGNITIQTMSMEGEPQLSEIEQIVDRLFQKLQQAR